jgi:hypothetical protein
MLKFIFFIILITPFSGYSQAVPYGNGIEIQQTVKFTVDSLNYFEQFFNIEIVKNKLDLKCTRIKESSFFYYSETVSDTSQIQLPESIFIDTDNPIVGTSTESMLLKNKLPYINRKFTYDLALKKATKNPTVENYFYAKYPILNTTTCLRTLYLENFRPVSFADTILVNHSNPSVIINTFTKIDSTDHTIIFQVSGKQIGSFFDKKNIKSKKEGESEFILNKKDYVGRLVCTKQGLILDYDLKVNTAGFYYTNFNEYRETPYYQSYSLIIKNKISK